MANKEEITQEELLQVIQEMVGSWGSQKAVADHLGISNAYMSDILAGNRTISGEVAKKLGYKRIVRFAKDAK
jgi:plasmid maintenance system antidote protein VapI